MGLRSLRASVSFAALTFAVLAILPAAAQATSWGTAATYSASGLVRPFSVATGNFNADSNLDFVIGDNGSGNVGVFLNNGSGSFTHGGNFDSTAFAGINAIAVGQLNADSNADLVVAGRNQGTYVMLGNGSGDSGPRHSSTGQRSTSRSHSWTATPTSIWSLWMAATS